METQTRPRPKGLPPAIRTLIWVIVVVGLMTALCVRPWIRARESARRTSCLNNLKQLHLGLMQYAQDFGDVYPWRVGVLSRERAWRDLGMLYPDYVSESRSFFCPSAKDRRSQLEREFFREMRRLKREGRTTLEPIRSSGLRAVISYSYCFNAAGGTLGGKAYPYLPWTKNAKSTVRLLADKKAGKEMTRRSSHWHLDALGRNVLYKDGHVKWKVGIKAIDPDEDDHEVGKPDARDYTAWWSDPPYYGE